MKMKSVKNRKDRKDEMKDAKKAEITTSQIVMIILLVVGFAIIIFFIIQLKWSGQVNQQVCHESVVLRGTLPSVTQGYVPLKCMTDKVCITSSMLGSCDEFRDVKGVTRVKVSSDKDKAKKDIEKVITQEIYNCWTMMGEGKISLFNQFMADRHGLGKIYSSCVICSRIAFDTNSLEKIGLTTEELKDVNIEEYMLSHKVPGKEISYYEYFSRGSNNAYVKVKEDLKEITIPTKFNEETKNRRLIITEDEKSKEIFSLQKEIPKEKTDEEVRNEIGVLFMQIDAPEQLMSIKNIAQDLGIVWGVAFLINRDITMKITLGVVSNVINFAISNPIAAFITAAGIIGTQQGLVAWNRAIAAGYCSDVSIGTGARNGCSVVRAVNYDAEQISNYCGVIEGIP